jgi:hypothetical protein
MGALPPPKERRKGKEKRRGDQKRKRKRGSKRKRASITVKGCMCVGERLSIFRKRRKNAPSHVSLKSSF